MSDPSTLDSTLEATLHLRKFRKSDTESRVRVHRVDTESDDLWNAREDSLIRQLRDVLRSRDEEWFRNLVEEVKRRTENK
jgi:hypothetical protein